MFEEPEQATRKDCMVIEHLFSIPRVKAAARNDIACCIFAPSRYLTNAHPFGGPRCEDDSLAFCVVLFDGLRSAQLASESGFSLQVIRTAYPYHLSSFKVRCHGACETCVTEKRRRSLLTANMLFLASSDLVL